MKRITAVLNDALDATITIVFIFMLLCAVMQVFFRYVLQVSIPWTEEAARFALILVTFWGAAAAIRQREHITIPTLFDKIPRAPRLALQAVFIIAMGVFLVNVFIGSLSMVKLTWETPVGSISWLTTGKVYLILPSGVVLMLLHLAGWLIETVLEIFRPAGETGKGAG